MSICNPDGIKSIIKKNECLLGLDIGSKTIGIARSDTNLKIATPSLVINRTKFTNDANDLVKVIDQENVGGLIVGLPLEMKGKEGKQAQSTRTFIDNFLKIREIPVVFWDERLSTKIINRLMIEEGSLSRKKRKRSIDKLAATYILQGLLDYI